MNTKSIQISLTEFENAAQLSSGDMELVKAAFTAASQAYAPYSGFTVGAALRLQNGMVITGNNQENAAYPSGLCAERVAMFYAASQYPEQAIETIAVVARADGLDLSEPATPCGSCRQVMAEYEQLHGKKLRVIMATENGKILLMEGVENLLPLAFLAKHLSKGECR